MWEFAKKPSALIRALLISLRKCSKTSFAELPVKHWHVSEEELVDSQCCGGLHREVLATGWTLQAGHVRAWASQKAENHENLHPHSTW